LRQVAVWNHAENHRVLDVDVTAERTGKPDAIDVIDAEALHQQRYAGIQRGLRELDGAHVGLGDFHLDCALMQQIGERSAVLDDSGRACGQAAVKDAVLVDDTRQVQLRHDFDDAGSADPRDAGGPRGVVETRIVGPQIRADDFEARLERLAVDPHALDGMLAAIDQGAPNSVYVMVVEDGSDIAGMGGLMGTAMSARNFSGAVVDGGVRDVAYLQKIGFPVFALGLVPSTSVGHYRFAGANIPVTCDGVAVSAGDIIAADADGVAAVPRASASEVLKVAQDMDFKEHSMYATIEKLKSIVEAVKQYGRL